MQKPVITLLSDFGDSFAESQIELVIYGINPDVRLVRIENKITPFSILEGAFVLSKYYHLSPPGSVHIGVVDPGVGSVRKGIIIKTTNYWFVGPDNGLFYPASQLDGIEEVYKINEKVFEGVSHTFHGRDVFSKVAAKLTLDENLANFAQPLTEQIIPLQFTPNQIVNIDPYGNIKFYVNDHQYQYGDTVRVQYGDKKVVAKFAHTFTDVCENEFIIYNGSHKTLELAVNLNSAAKTLNAKIGDIIHLQKLE